MPSLQRTDGPFPIPAELPVVPLRDLVFFPYMVLPLLIGREASLAALGEADQGEGLLLLLAQRDAALEDPSPEDLHRVGTVVRLLQVTRLPEGIARVVFEGLGRAMVEILAPEGAFLRAQIRIPEGGERETPQAVDPETEALARTVRKLFEEYVERNPRLPRELASTLAGVQDRVRMAHLISGHLLLEVSEKQELLEAPSLRRHLELLRDILARELEILRIEAKLDEEIQQQMDSDRRQLYLQEQLKAIHRELGAAETEWDELEKSISSTALPPRVRERAEREMARLRRLNPVAPEAAVIRTYLDWILALPWIARSQDNLDVSHAAQILDQAHYGLEEVKARILEHISVLSLVGNLQGPILCLVGPPGVGKTSLGRSIAKALGRDFIRTSLGGVRDEAEIRGHRRTYVGAFPGRILQGMRRSGTRNPVFLLDEVDKLARDFHGDPGAALLEVLDPEQNRAFVDHYLELEFDLSDVFFLATANTLVGIPEPLRDRMEVLRIPGYLPTEKKDIARRFLWPKEAVRHGLDPAAVRPAEESLEVLVSQYTREAGVRDLERALGSVARKLARSLVEGRWSPAAGEVVEPARIRRLLGPPPFGDEGREGDPPRVGMANGLAWTAAGGQILDVEVAVVPGSGNLRLTGALGEVMKESAWAALTYARARYRLLGLSPHFHQELDIHIHIPEGATPKDGPSAGITIAAALVSALTNIPTRPEVAMTGEITLRGRVLGVGGIREKAVAAFQGGIREMLLPASSVGELERLPVEVREGMIFVPVRTMDEVLERALSGPLSSGTAEPGDASGGGAVHLESPSAP